MPKRFLEVFLDTNNMCNLRCITCVFSDPRVAKLPKYVMPWELYTKIADQVFPHAQYLALSCLTEPLMTRNFSDYLRYAARFEIPRVELVTNAMLLRDEHLDAIVDARLWRMAVSVDGCDAETYEAVRRGASWNRLVENLGKATDRFRSAPHRPSLRIVMTLVQENFRAAPDATRLFIEWGATEIEIRETITFPGFGLKNRQLQSHGEELAEKLLESQAIARAAGVPLEILSDNAPGLRIDLAHLPTCPTVERRLAIPANGDALPCMLWAREPLGNFREMSFEEIWHGERRQAYLAQFKIEKPLFWCPDCTICKEDPADDDAYFRLLAKPKPESATGPTLDTPRSPTS